MPPRRRVASKKAGSKKATSKKVASKKAGSKKAAAEKECVKVFDVTICRDAAKPKPKSASKKRASRSRSRSVSRSRSASRSRSRSASASRSRATASRRAAAARKSASRSRSRSRSRSASAARRIAAARKSASRSRSRSRSAARRIAAARKSASRSRSRSHSRSRSRSATRSPRFGSFASSSRRTPQESMDDVWAREYAQRTAVPKFANPWDAFQAKGDQVRRLQYADPFAPLIGPSIEQDAPFNYRFMPEAKKDPFAQMFVDQRKRDAAGFGAGAAPYTFMPEVPIARKSGFSQGYFDQLRQIEDPQARIAQVRENSAKQAERAERSVVGLERNVTGNNSNNGLGFALMIEGLENNYAKTQQAATKAAQTPERKAEIERSDIKAAGIVKAAKQEEEQRVLHERLFARRY